MLHDYSMLALLHQMSDPSIKGGVDLTLGWLNSYPLSHMTLREGWVRYCLEAEKLTCNGRHDLQLLQLLFSL
ncbi:hypothetical protein D3C73_1620240 [compost metagenome]